MGECGRVWEFLIYKQVLNKIVKCRKQLVIKSDDSVLKSFLQPL